MPVDTRIRHQFVAVLDVLAGLVVTECGAHLAQSVVLRLALLMGIDLQRDGQPRVAKDELGVAGRYPHVLTGRERITNHAECLVMGTVSGHAVCA
jgi:hypothetical protein